MRKPWAMFSQHSLASFKVSERVKQKVTFLAAPLFTRECHHSRLFFMFNLVALNTGCPARHNPWGIFVPSQVWAGHFSLGRQTSKTLHCRATGTEDDMAFIYIYVDVQTWTHMCKCKYTQKKPTRWFLQTLGVSFFSYLNKVGLNSNVMDCSSPVIDSQWQTFTVIALPYA